MSTASEATNAGHQPAKAGWLINRNYRLLFIGQGISLIGDQVSTYTMIMWIITIIAAGQTWAPLALSAVIVVGTIPTLLIGPLAGVFVDRWNRRLTMLAMDAIRATLILLLLLFTNIVPLPFFAQGKVPAIWQLVAICCVTFGVSTCAQFFSPAHLGLIGEVVPPDKRHQAAGLNQSMAALAAIVGPPLAAPLLIAFGVQWALVIDVLSYIASLGTLWALQSRAAPAQETPHASLKSEFLEGIRFSFSNQIIRMLIVTFAIAALGTGAIEALYIFFIQYNLHTDVKLAGIAGAMLGIGTIIGSLFAAKIGQLIGLKKTLYLSFLLMGLLTILFARQTNFVLAMAIIFLLGMVLIAVRVAITPLMLKETPSTMIGRVMAVMGPLSTCAGLLSTSLAGSLASILLVRLHASFLGMTWGAIDTIFVAVGCIFLVAALYIFGVSRKLAID